MSLVRKKSVLAVGVLLFLIVSIGAILYLLKLPHDIRKRAREEVADFKIEIPSEARNHRQGDPLLLGDYPVPEELVGQECWLTATFVNNNSIWPGVNVYLSVGLWLNGVEDATQDGSPKVTIATTTTVLGESIEVWLHFGPDGRSSFGGMIELTCAPIPTPTPTLSPSATPRPTSSPTPTPFASVSPSPGLVGQCRDIRLYRVVGEDSDSDNWLRIIDLASIQAGDTIYVTVLGIGDTTRARIRLNSSSWTQADETRSLKPGTTDEYYRVFALPDEGTTSFIFDGEVCLLNIDNTCVWI